MWNTLVRTAVVIAAAYLVHALRVFADAPLSRGA